LFNIICLVLSFIVPAKNRPPKETSESAGFFSRFSKNRQSSIERDTEAIGADVTKGDMEAATNITADSSRR
jgi:hypothetical protein